MSCYDAWTALIRRQAEIVLQQRAAKMTLVATSYNPKTHSVKGMVMPHNVESGWVRLGAIHAGNGYGILCGPKVGSAEGLDGDVYDIDFEDDDPQRPVARHRHFSTADAPPEVQSGEMLLRHESGTQTMYAKDGSVTTTHGTSKGVQSIDADGNMMADAMGRDITHQSTGGTISLNAKAIILNGVLVSQGA